MSYINDKGLDSYYTDLYKNLFNACAHLIVKNKNLIN